MMLNAGESAGIGRPTSDIDIVLATGDEEFSSNSYATHGVHQ